MLPDWDPRVVQVKKVMARLVPFAERLGLHDTQWEVSVIESPEANAFVVPGCVHTDSVQLLRGVRWLTGR